MLLVLGRSGHEIGKENSTVAPSFLFTKLNLTTRHVWRSDWRGDGRLGCVSQNDSSSEQISVCICQVNVFKRTYDRGVITSVEIVQKKKVSNVSSVHLLLPISLRKGRKIIYF